VGNSVCRTRNPTHNAAPRLDSYKNLQFRKVRPPPTFSLPVRLSQVLTHHFCLHSFDPDPLDMRPFAFIITVFSLFTFCQLFFCVIP